MRSSLLLILILPLSILGQGFILVDSFCVPNAIFLNVEHKDPYYDQIHNGFIYTTSDSVVLLKATKDGIQITRIMSPTSPSGFNIPSVQIFGEYITEYDFNDNLMLFDKNTGVLKSVKKIKRRRHKSIAYSFQDDDFIYMISYYNRGLKDKSKSHDLVYFYKLSKNGLKLVKSTSFDIGKEIILAPFNHQLISFNQEHFFIADRIGHRLFKVSKDLKVCDTLILNRSLGESNTKAFNVAFPDETVKTYLHQPKMVIEHFSLSEYTKTLTTVFKTFFLDDSTLAIVYKNGVYPSHTFDLEILNSNSQNVILRRTIPYRGDDLSPFAWTQRIYATVANHYMTISLGRGINAQRYVAKIWTFSNEKSISSTLLFETLAGDSSIVKPYSGVILADHYFCKGCYGSAGPGVGVLVICKIPDVNLGLLDVIREKQKRQWKIKGDLIFVESSVYDSLSAKLQPNNLTPIGNE